MARTHSNDFATTSSVYPYGQEPMEKVSTSKTHIRNDSRSSSMWWPNYPSWLPRRPSAPHPPTTRPSTAAAEELPDIPVTPLSFDFGRVATPRSVRILSDPSQHPRHQATGETQVPADTPTLKASRRSRQSWTRPRRPRFRAPGLRLEQLESPSFFTQLRYRTLPIFVFAHLFIQTFFDLNAVYILIQVTKFPSPSSISPASNRAWTLATAAYIFCWVVQIFGIFIVYELAYSFYRRWRTKRPLISPLYLSAPAHKLVSLTSYRNFCYLRFVRRSAFSSESGDHTGCWQDGWAETFYFYSQNLSTVATLLPRAALCLALLFTFALSGGGNASGSSSRDATFFHASNGTLTNYARGVLIANAVWSAWRTLIVLGSFCGLWLLSGKACAGLCGPRHRYDEEDEREERATQSLYSRGSVWEDMPEHFDALGWSWRERTHGRIRYAWEFCLTSLPERMDDNNAEKRPAPATMSSSLPAEELDKILGAAGYPEPPTPAKRRDRSLPQDFFEEPMPPSPAQELSDILPPVTSSPAKGKGRDAPLMQLPHPFNVAGPSSPSGSSFGGKGAPDPFAVGATNVPFPFTVYEDQPASPPRAGATQQIRLSEYEESTDEDIENEIIGAFEVGSSEGQQSPISPHPASGRPSSSLSSLGQPLSRNSVNYPLARRRPGERSSEEGTRAVGESGSSESHSSGRGEASFPPPPRQRAQTGPSSSSSGESYARSHPRIRTFSSVSKTSSKRGEPQPEPEPESMIVSESGYMDEFEDDVEAAEREDSVGLLSPSVSPRSSLGGSRGSRARSLGYSARKSNGSRSASGSAQSGTSGSRSASHSNSADGSIRNRAQSLVQAALAPVTARTRSRAQSAASSLAPPARISEENHRSSSDSSGQINQEQHTFGQPLPWARRLEIASDIGSDGATHSRQDSSGSALSAPGTEGDHTFGLPLPAHIRHPERFESQNEDEQDPPPNGTQTNQSA